MIVTLTEDSETGDLLLPLPDELLLELGLNIGDTLQWTVCEDGSIKLSKKQEHSKYYYDTERNK